MKTLKSIIHALVLVLSLQTFAQDLQQGFSYLETGQYQNAEQFFYTVLQDHPKNKTAKLCYGRAIGLNGKPEAALQLFQGLLQDYPNDFEVKLNYGESLLWNSNFTDAKIYYGKLVDEQPENFNALLGYANTLSNLKDYDNALIFIDRALEVSPGNPNALTSKKYIYLGYAYQNQQVQNYDKAESLLIKNLQLFDDDKDTLLNLANLYLIWDKIEDAEATYQRLAARPEHNIQALNGLALVAHLNNTNKKALELSTTAYSSLNKTTDSTIVKQTTERYAQALIWNKKYRQATELINGLIETFPNQNWVLALRATLNVYKSNFKESLDDYNQILANDSTSFDGNLGKANVLKALGRYNEAYDAANKTLNFYDKQKDALIFIEQLDRTFAPQIDSRASHTFDNGNNTAYTLSTAVTYPLSKKLRLLGNYNFRSTNNTVTNATAQTNNLSFGLSYDIAPNITLKGIAGLALADTQQNNFSQLLTDVSVNIKALKLQSIDLGYKRQVESFNTDLLERELVQNSIYANYNLSTNFNLGWYTQVMHMTQNDGNRRNLLFTSLYYNLMEKPGLKIGANYQYITFKDQVPTIYFSPEQFHAYEVFVNLSTNENTARPKAWFYNLTGAFGYQFIEDDPKQTAFRLQGALGYKFSDRSLLNLYGTHSNIASATAAGFRFSEIGLRFNWVFLER